MKKMHIIRIGYCDYAVASITAANQIAAAFSKAVRVDHNHDGEKYIYEPTMMEETEISIKINQNFKPRTPIKDKALPSPKRNSIPCVCGQSTVAPRELCRRCGASYFESFEKSEQS